MGECLTPVPVKFRAETVAGLDAMRAQIPCEPGQSTIVRTLIEELFLLIAEGILQFRVATGKRLLSVSREVETRSIPGTTEVFPNAKKPPVRVDSSEDYPTDSHGRRRFGTTHRMADVDAAGGIVLIPFKSLPFLAKSRQINYMRAAA